MELVKRLFCLLALLPAPGVIAKSRDFESQLGKLGCSSKKVPPWKLVFEEIIFQAYPLPRFRTGCDDVSSFVKFQLYIKPGDDARILTLGDVATLSKSGFDPRKRTMMYMPGWAQSPTGLSTVHMRDALLAHASYNVIIADYVNLIGVPWYPVAVNNTPPIGRHVALFIDFLAAHGGLRTSSLHVIGVSLGAQVAAVVGASVRSGRIARITGLDPAFPGFSTWNPEHRLSKAHAHFVDIIHTDIVVSGINSSVGHVDFYPNGGSNQPGCLKEEVVKRNGSGFDKYFCNHIQTLLFFVESLRREHAFPATPCDSWKNFKANKCHSKRPHVYMGIATPSKARGDYFLSTKNVHIKDIFVEEKQT